MASLPHNTSATENHQDPYKNANLDQPDLKTKVDDLVEFMKKCKFSMMTTHGSHSDNLVSRCMSLAATETQGIDLLFYTNTESGKTDDLAANPHVNVAFINGTGEWASICGHASIVTDRSLVKEHYSASLRAWMGDLGDGVHDGSEKDPRIAVIRVRTDSATYCLVSKNIVSRAADVAQGVLTGKPASVNKLREISAADVVYWRGLAEEG